MIDTIVLTLPIHHFRILNPEFFEPNANWMHSQPFIAQIKGVRKCVQNPTKEDGLMGVYKPRLTLIRRWDWTKGIITLKIEFSIPKLIFWNNFDELSDDDFPDIIKALHDRLSDMGIEVTRGKLEIAIVSTIHYWKNIVLDDYTSVSQVLSNIAKTNISSRFDTGETNYQNGWELFRLHSKSFQIVFYDKIADLNKTQARAIEKDNRDINYQMSFFDDIRKRENKTHHKAFDVLRMEIRFMNKQKLARIHKDLKINFPNPFTFQDAFCMENARKILEHHWNLFYVELQMLSFLEMKPIDRLGLLLQKSNWTPTKTFAMGFLMVLIADDAYRDIRKQFEAKYNPRSLKRLYDEIKNLQGNRKPFWFIETISRAFSVYKPLQLKKYMYTEVNNS